MSGATREATEDETFDDAFDRLFRIAYRSAFRLLGSREDAEDVAIEATARAAMRWQRLLPEPDPWVTTVSVNLSIDLWRRRSRAATHDRTSVPGPDRDEGVAHDHDDQRIDLARALGRLPRRQRDAIVLRYFGDFTEAQTAAMLGVTLGTVKQHTSRGLARLRRDVDAHFGGSSDA
jgi:RNA polymerase sigma-70 factor (sigma-E family)